jgi:RNA polymerase sigma-70 factor (ECF subfamily)
MKQSALRSALNYNREVIRNMEQISFEELVAAHYNTLLRIAVQHTGNRAEAEDIVQDTFLKLLETGKHFRDHEHAKAFLIRSAVNRCFDYLKSARRTRNIALTDAEENALPPDSGGFRSEETLAVLEAMRSLRPEYRNVIYLYYYEEYSIKEIAAILRKSSNTVSSWLTRAKKQLREVLNDEQDDVSEGHAADFRRKGGDSHESKANAGAV